MTTLQRYALKEILAPTGLGLIVFTFVFLVGQLFKLADTLLNSGIPAQLSLELIALLLPGVMSLTIPMAVLVGVLLGVGRLAADREVLAIRASGISITHLAKPIIAFTIVVSSLMVWANMRLIPYLNLKSADLQVQVLFHALSAIPTGTPIELPTEGEENQDTSILIDSKDQDTGHLRGVTILTQIESTGEEQEVASKVSNLNTETIKEALADDDETTESKAEKKKKKKSQEGRIAERRAKQAKEWNRLLTQPVQDIIVMAEEGSFDPVIDDRVVYVRLKNGSIQLSDPHNPAAYDVIRFDTLTKGIVPTFSKIEKGYFEKDPREMSTNELREQIQIRDKGRKYSTELYQRLSVPMACIAFALIAFPLAVYVRPTGKAVAFGISFLLILFYYGLLQYGVAMSQSGKSFGPFAIFLPNGIIAIIGCFMLYRIVTR